MPGSDLQEELHELHPLEARVTITLWVTSAVLSGMRLAGSQFDFLIPSPETWPGSIWTLFTTCLLHGGLLHLVFNIFWTMRLGTAAEALIGSPGMLFFVVLTGLGSGAVQWAFTGPYVGLSGIVYGLFGLLWAIDRWHPRGRGVMDPQTTTLMVMWFFLCIVLTSAGSMQVANLAHGFGALLGVILGWSVSRSADQRGWRWFAFPLAAMACALVPLIRTPEAIHVAQAEKLFQLGNRSLQEGDASRERGLGVEARASYAEAEAYYRDSLALREFASTHWNLSIALDHLGQGQEAEAARKIALDKDPSLARLRREDP